ncbi:hypothetical protein E2P81_ATG11602 [Venturia nashicola]|nr:hypothetical protein E2P81_ATG11602 [Venturia nashicola]
MMVVEDVVDMEPSASCWPEVSTPLLRTWKLRASTTVYTLPYHQSAHAILPVFSAEFFLISPAASGMVVTL